MALITIRQMAMMRINKFIASCGISSRRKAEDFIKKSQVTVNGKTITDLAFQINEDKDTVLLNGKIIRPVRKFIHVLLNKPKGYVTTAKDEKGRKTVFNLVPMKTRLFSVGRLDANSEGLLLLTNDGKLAHRIMHPRFNIVKIYRIKLDRAFNPDDFTPLTSGVELEDGLTTPCEAGYYIDDLSRIEIKLHEGRNRQVRRMLKVLGYNVKALKRTAFGPLTLAGLAHGKWRALSKSEEKQLYNSVGLA